MFEYYVFNYSDDCRIDNNKIKTISSLVNLEILELSTIKNKIDHYKNDYYFDNKGLIYIKCMKKLKVL
jgi:hypothetical protein